MEEKIIKNNKYSLYKYEILKTFDAGIVLYGKDVKAIKANSFEIKEAFVKLESNELFLWNIIFANEDTNLSKRKLLFHRSEIDKISTLLRDKRVQGFVINVRYTGRNIIKLNIGFGRSKKEYDKKTADKRMTEKRNMERMIDDELN